MIYGKAASDNYDDIINLPHHVSETRPRMSSFDRAAQFSAFAALSGHNDAIKETSRLVKNFSILDENIKSILNEKLQMIIENIDNSSEVTVTYFKQDSKKDGGEYIDLTDCVKFIDTDRRSVIMSGGTDIPIDSIYDISGSMFDTFEY